MVKLRYHGHACWEIINGKDVILIDPFLTGNPLADIKPEEINPTAIIVTHGHGDHLGDTVQIATRTDATVIGVFELVEYVTSKGVKNSYPINAGAKHTFPWGKVKGTIAFHSSSTPDGVYTGQPVGYIIEIGEKVIYHAGDTALFLDMQLIGEMNKIDVALLPIGDTFTMGIEEACKAVEFLKPKITIPMHYSTFDLITQDPKAFAPKLSGTDVVVVKPGEEFQVP
jgi:L-ascorbate metabolism protein UlaG (beta-lactamase superfamily)